MFSKESFPFEDAPESKVLSFLPLNHIFEKTVTYIYLYSGISIYYAESLDTIGDNLKEVQPDGFTTVPRLLEKVFEKISLLNKEIEVKNQLIGQLLHVIAEHKIQLPVHILKILDVLYNKKEKTHKHISYDSINKH